MILLFLNCFFPLSPALKGQDPRFSGNRSVLAYALTRNDNKMLFVEYISLNEVRGFRRGAAQNFWFEAAIWKNLALEWEEKDLFLPLKNNRNLHVLQDQLNLICLKYNIFPHLEQDGEQSFKKDADAFQMDLMQYFQAAKERCRLNASGRSKSVMADLWGEAEKLALPVLNAKEELLTIQKPKAKSAENIRKSKKG